MDFDINQPVTNPELIGALLAFNEDSTLEKQKQFFGKLKEARLLAPIIMVLSDNVEKKEDNSLLLKKDSKISFITISNNLNETYFLAFTDWDELRKWQNIENQQTLIVNIADYQSLLKDSKDCKGIVINPYNEAIQIDRSLLDVILTDNFSVKPVTIQKDTEVILGSPIQYPQPLIDALSKYLQTKIEVKSAYLRLMLQDQQQSYLIVIDINQDADPKNIFQNLGEVIKPYLFEDKYIDFIPANTTFGQQAIKGAEPFYQREKKGFFQRLFGR